MDQDNSKKWAMPEPKFRRSEGEPVTPMGNEYIDPEPDTLAPDIPEETEIETAEFDIGAPAPAPAQETAKAADSGMAAINNPAVAAPPAGDPLAKLYDPPTGPLADPPKPSADPVAAPVAVEPQPLISEQFPAGKIDVKGVGPAATKTRRPILALLGLLVLLVAVAALAGLVYFLFFAGRTPLPVN